MQFYVNTSNHLHRTQDYLQWEAAEEAVAGALCPWNLSLVCVSYPSERGAEKSGRGLNCVENTKCCEFEFEFKMQMRCLCALCGCGGRQGSSRGCGAGREHRDCRNAGAVSRAQEQLPLSARNRSRGAGMSSRV